MTFFELLLALLVAAIALLQVSRRLSLPYPSMLALAGVVVALIPGAPTIRLDPTTALALFIAPVLLDAAYDFPAGAAQRLWRPLVVLAVAAVLATAAAVAWIGWYVAGLPLAAAVVLGAIVAPPDAAAATAVIGTVSVPRRTAGVLKGESLFNDATALFLFSEALSVQTGGGIEAATSIGLALAVPGGLLMGIGLGWVARRLHRFVDQTLGGNVLQFVQAFLVWTIAERLHLSAVLAVVAFAMTVARADRREVSPLMRLHSNAVWATVVFLLNVLAFLLMGMQARVIVARMPIDRLTEAAGFAGLVILAVVAMRFAVVAGWVGLATRFETLRGGMERPSLRQGLLVGWSGMRGLLTLATSFALPAGFPQRDLVVLTAFAVVLATLIVQGLTLGPIIRLLGLERSDALKRELATARGELAGAALSALGERSGPEADRLRQDYGLVRDEPRDSGARDGLARRRDAGLAAIGAERDRLHAMRADGSVGADSFAVLRQELDLRELTMLPEEDRSIEEI